MSQPVKLSNALVLDARTAAEAQERSIAGQVEYWAKMGKLVDALLDGRSRTRALERSKGKPLSELIASVGTPEGDARLKAYLATEPYPHYDPHPTIEGLLIRIDKNGTRKTGRFVDRKFVIESKHLSKDSGSRRNRNIRLVHKLKAV
jgi:rhodanese-related sulfurtransferase